MVLALYVIALAYLGQAASDHFEWDSYHWGQQPGQHQLAPQSQPISNEYHQHQQNYGLSQDQRQPDHFAQFQDQDHQQNDGFQGYPRIQPSNAVQPLQPTWTTAPPTTEITPAPNSVPTDMPKHRILLRQLYQQVLGQNFTQAVQHLAFLSSPPSLQAGEYPQPAEPQYDLAQYIEPPPPPQFSDPFNYYS